MKVIQLENVSKMYRLGEVGTGTIGHDLARAWAKFRGKEDPFAKIGQVNNREESGGEYVWALKDINLEVEEGEILGIIGRNGAGKSTLLKLLSRVTAPTTGRIRARGRIASLLEVGTGFHPELTGRENVYLNGALLGMTRAEITKRLDRIVEFSGCAKYIDTPVKRYSSGMMVRLGFAVAAHLECEILIVDEVLAVGDAEFQKKCIGKMEEISGGGKTVLLVTHQLSTIESLATQVAVVAHGGIASCGSVKQSLALYTSRFSKAATNWFGHRLGQREDHFVPRRFFVSSDGRTPLNGVHPVNQPITFVAEGEVHAADPHLVLGIAIYNELGQTLFRAYHTDVGNEIPLTTGNCCIRCQIPAFTLNEGRYNAELIAGIHPVRWILAPQATPVSVDFEINGGFNASNHWTTKRPGEISPLIPFNVEQPGNFTAGKSSS